MLNLNIYGITKRKYVNFISSWRCLRLSVVDLPLDTISLSSTILKDIKMLEDDSDGAVRLVTSYKKNKKKQNVLGLFISTRASKNQRAAIR